MALRLHPMTTDEAVMIQRLAHSRTEPARRCPLSRGSCGSAKPPSAPGWSVSTVRGWPVRQEAPRPGRPATYTSAQVSEIIATSLTKPQELSLPFASWTLDRLATYVQEVKDIPIKRSRIDELLLREGLR